MQKTIPLHNGKTLCAVKVPEGADLIRVLIGNLTWRLTHDKIVYNALPPGNWRILGIATELTEEQKKEVVEFSEMAAEGIDEHEGGYMCYERGYWYHKDVNESYASFLAANKLYHRMPDECENPFCENGKIDMGYNEYMRCFACEDNEEQVGCWMLLIKEL